MDDLVTWRSLEILTKLASAEEWEGKLDGDNKVKKEYREMYRGYGCKQLFQGVCLQRCREIGQEVERGGCQELPFF